MDIQVTEKGGIRVIRLVGHVDLSVHKDLLDLFRSFMSDNVRRIIVNMAGVQVLSSSGVGAIFNMSREMQKSGGKLIVSSASESADKILRMLRMDELIEMQPTDDDAIRALANLP